MVEIPIEFWDFFKNPKFFEKHIFGETFFISKKNLEKNLNTYVDAKFPQDSKNHT